MRIPDFEPQNTILIPSDDVELKLLAMAEELDAAIGGIMQALVDAEIEDQTVVIYTSDHGQQRQFGNPNFGRGKSTIAEGGTRVGLIVHAPGPLNGFTPAQSALEEQLVSEVDVFPTIAHFARYDRVDTLDPSDGRVTPLYSGGCSPGTAACARETDGRSLLTAMFHPAATVHRDGVFLREPYDKKSKEGIVTRAGFVDTLNTPGCNATGDPDYCDYAKGVCGVDDLETETFCGSGSSANLGAFCTSNVDCRSTQPLGEGVCETRTVRRIRAASAVVCDPDDPASTNDCQEQPCLVQGGLCMSDLEWAECSDPALTCIPHNYARCTKSSDCPSGASCRPEVLVKCTDCYAASWKLVEGSGEYKSRLIDVATNPEEDALYEPVGTAAITLDLAWAAECGDPDTAVCPDPAPLNLSGAPTQAQSVCNVKNKLFCMLHEWSQCSLASTEEQCDAAALGDPN